MRMVFTHDVTDDMSTFLRWLINGVASDRHIENDAALDGF